MTARMTTGIRPVERHDVDAVVGLVHELADYERAAEHCLLTADQLHTALFGPSPALYGHVAEVADENGRATVVGCALWFLNFSTFSGRAGIYLEDLFVRPAHRHKGIGKALMIHLAARCVENGWARLQWSVLDWNAPSIDFYKSLGAVLLDDWTGCRVSGDALTGLARQAR